MTQKEILEGNKLIAIFIGAEFVNDAPDDYPKGYYYLTSEEFDLPYAAEDFNFHASWDWLMPVVEKIENQTLQCNRDYYFSMGSVIGGKYQCYIEKSAPGMSKPMYMKGYKADTFIQAVYISIVKFIKWYNENKKT